MNTDGSNWEGQSAAVIGAVDWNSPAEAPQFIDSSGLSGALSALRGLVPEIAAAFDPKDLVESFKDCEEALAERARLIWEDFLENCASYQRALNIFRDKFRTWPSEVVGIRERAVARLEAAKETLTESFRRTIMATQDGERVTAQKTDGVGAAKEEVEIVQTDIKKHRIAVTGDPNGDIPAPQLTRAFLVGVIGAVIYGLIEVMAGTDYFKNVGSLMGAIGAMALLVVIVSLLGVGLGMTWKRWLYWRHASEAYEERYRENPAPGAAPEFYRLDPEIRWICVICFVVLLIGSSALAYWRIRLAETNELLQGSSGIVWIVFVAQWLLVVVEFYISSGYDTEHYWTLKQLERELVSAQERLRERLNPGRVQPTTSLPGVYGLPPAAESAVRDYQTTVKEIKQTLAGAVAEARKDRDRYLRRYFQCKDALEDRVIPHYRVLIGDLATAVRRPCIQAGIDPKLIGTVDRLDILTICVMGDERPQRAKQFDPKIEFPTDKEIDQFADFYKGECTKALNEMNDKIRYEVASPKLRMSPDSSSHRPSAIVGQGKRLGDAGSGDGEAQFHDVGFE